MDYGRLKWKIEYKINQFLFNRKLKKIEKVLAKEFYKIRKLDEPWGIPILNIDDDQFLKIDERMDYDYGTNRVCSLGGPFGTLDDSTYCCGLILSSYYIMRLKSKNDIIKFFAPIFHNIELWAKKHYGNTNNVEIEYCIGNDKFIQPQEGTNAFRMVVIIRYLK